ncbi:MAG: TPM domain-containing protein [Bacteroidales bacterium]|nr:TPM domain-containing protein [Bacteroidales bacterium]MDD2425366.1 TPM domain-containing protein [Bacteroidales bacterium]MDD3988783.1 TPM domain-containing protein [Bacteroidales bacterium]MDD4638888.1 TPM domain-containing protein [Bacteroidales bacterium]
MSKNPFITEDERDRIIRAIESAELKTSGEIRIHLESYCKGDPVERAVLIFNRLEMHKTEQRNGVLIYVALKSRKLSIIGDSGINSVVPANFWSEVKDILKMYISRGELSDGLISAVALSGDKLGEFFPYKKDDVNEQSNEISFGK